MDKPIKVPTGLNLISNERLEQLVKHNRSVEDDIKNNANCELSEAAAAIISKEKENFPWSDTEFDVYMSKSRVEQLAIAGALIAAEIDRIQNS